jgi:hypothetical protein
VGICTSSTTINACNGGGTLSQTTCDGVCTQVGVLDGRVLGYCRAECEEGARECIGGALYRSCDHGRWSVQASVCQGGTACNPLATGAIPDIRCGGACDPGTSRCADDGSGVEDCNDSGIWEAGQQCLLGACTPKGPQAECQAECSADQFQCSEDGASAQRSCNAQSLWDPATDCAAGSSCRMSGVQSLGCVACVGPKNSQGNAYGVSDSKCEANGVSQCGDDNSWQAPIACAAGQTCVELHQGASTVAYCQSN